MATVKLDPSNGSTVGAASGSPAALAVLAYVIVAVQAAMRAKGAA